MNSVQQGLPYTRQPILYELYNVLDSKKSEYNKMKNGGIATGVTVYGSRREVTLSGSEHPPVAVLTVESSAPCEGLSRQGG